jgi:hypothetical protein
MRGDDLCDESNMNYKKLGTTGLWVVCVPLRLHSHGAHDFPPT